MVLRIRHQFHLRRNLLTPTVARGCAPICPEQTTHSVSIWKFIHRHTHLRYQVWLLPLRFGHNLRYRLRPTLKKRKAKSKTERNIILRNTRMATLDWMNNQFWLLGTRQGMKTCDVSFLSQHGGQLWVSYIGFYPVFITYFFSLWSYVML